jgi:tRNA (cmo5U34)-methyltransferase
MNSKDKVFSKPLSEISDFKFDNHVVSVFPDMINRSVPGYAAIIDHIGDFARLFVKESSNVYDLGASLGAATLSMRRAINAPEVTMYAVDNSEAMVKRCQQILAAYESCTPVEVIQGDINQVAITNASMVVLNFTLQFIPLTERQQLINNIYQGLNPGGILILSEKLKFTNELTQSVITDLHHDFKRANGYSELEISQKREALQNVLIPETFADHQDRLQAAGFRSADIWFQQYNFASMIAVK